ncbi:Eco57I restriction-modification methylase domain-containing protein [Natronorarus salvus]|uniref:Eco57I restriction-modification methylase domain-containing protein n=1 Tax=Natronorarus salvus TaxID=3117733 RepID=UPI002F26DF00
MKGHVPTPPELADSMVEKLFSIRTPKEGDRVLYPGMGTGPFVAAVERFCEREGMAVPDGIGVELDPELLAESQELHAERTVDIMERDFLRDLSDLDSFEYIIGNPPYVPIEDLDEKEKTRYKGGFDTATGRFDLYALFFEQALTKLTDDGVLVFVTPEKFEYVGSAAPLRKLLQSYSIEEIEHVAEDSFDGVTAYPTITTITQEGSEETRVVRRDGTSSSVVLPKDGSSWASQIRGVDLSDLETGVTLGEVCSRISCGVATGADGLFVQNREEVPPQLLDEWTYPTTSGKQLQLNDGPDCGSVFISPYAKDGSLIDEDELGDFGQWAEMHRDRLEDRYCYQNGHRAWYAWHERPPLDDILQPKILCQDIAKEPKFWIDESGEVVPRHTVYYLIPEDHVDHRELAEYLNGPEARVWLEANCQRAANGYYRLQSKVLKELPVPREFGAEYQATLV